MSRRAPSASASSAPLPHTEKITFPLFVGAVWALSHTNLTKKEFAATFDAELQRLFAPIDLAARREGVPESFYTVFGNVPPEKIEAELRVALERMAAKAMLQLQAEGNRP